jgi:hypothetical protein
MKVFISGDEPPEEICKSVEPISGKFECQLPADHFGKHKHSSGGVTVVWSGDGERPDRRRKNSRRRD